MNKVLQDEMQNFKQAVPRNFAITRKKHRLIVQALKAIREKYNQFAEMWYIILIV